MSERSWRNRLIMGTAIGAAAIAVAIDHTRHPLPPPAPAAESLPAAQQGAALVIVDQGQDSDQQASPCALGDSPCALSDSPCALDSAPCSL
jgi:hypothetical protein